MTSDLLMPLSVDNRFSNAFSKPPFKSAGKMLRPPLSWLGIEWSSLGTSGLMNITKKTSLRTNKKGPGILLLREARPFRFQVRDMLQRKPQQPLVQPLSPDANLELAWGAYYRAEQLHLYNIPSHEKKLAKRV